MSAALPPTATILPSGWRASALSPVVMPGNTTRVAPAVPKLASGEPSGLSRTTLAFSSLVAVTAVKTILWSGCTTTAVGMVVAPSFRSPFGPMLGSGVPPGFRRAMTPLPSLSLPRTRILPSSCTATEEGPPALTGSVSRPRWEPDSKVES